MKKTSPVSLAAAVFLAAVAFTNNASAQTTNVWQGGSNGSFVWTNTANWTGGVIPDATDSAAVFTNNATNSGINWTSTITLGKITNQFGSSSVVIGSTAHAGDVLTLSRSGGATPEIFVTNNGTIFMYANVGGTSFDKTGAGNLSFRFNPDNMTYTGDIGLNAGTLTVNQDGSLGNTANDILVRSNATLSVSPGNNTGTIVLGSGRDIKITNGVTFSLQTTAATINATVNGNITGHRVDFIGGSWGVSDATSTKYTLNGTGNTWSNRTTIQMGAKVVLGAGSSISTGDLSFSGGAGTWAGLDLGGNTQNVVSLDTASSTATARVFVINNGTLNVTNASASYTVNGTNGTLVDMSGLTAFSFNGAATNRNFTVTPSTASGVLENTNTVRLATTGIGSNNISAGNIVVGGGSGASQGNNNRGRLIMGAINEFSANNFRIGGFNGEGEVDFATTGSLKLRGSNGVAAMTLLAVGDTSSGLRRGTGLLNLGTADVLVTDTIIGNIQANGVANMTHTNRITMGGGTFTSANLYIGTHTNPAGNGNTLTNVSIFQQDDGTSSITLVRMGDNRVTATNNAIAFQSSYVIGGTTAVLRATTIDAGTNAIFGANASRTLTISNGGTLRNASGTDLSVTGFDSTTAGRMNIDLAGGSKLEADSGQTVTFGANTRLSGAGNLTKLGAGTLVLSSGIAGANTGALNISNGAVNLNGASVAAAGTITSIAVASTAKLLVSQSDQVNNAATVSLSGGTIARASGVSETFGTLDLTADSTLDYVGGTLGTLQFGDYEGDTTPDFKLTVNNFFGGNVLKFGSDLSSYISASYTGTAFTSTYFDINSISGGFTSAWDNGAGVFTITAIPEPSTVLAALGLTGLMLWPARRRIGTLLGRK